MRFRSYASDEHDQPAVIDQGKRKLKRKQTQDPEGNPQYPPLSLMVMAQQLDRDDDPARTRTAS